MSMQVQHRWRARVGSIGPFLPEWSFSRHHHPKFSTNPNPPGASTTRRVRNYVSTTQQTAARPVPERVPINASIYACSPQCVQVRIKRHAACGPIPACLLPKDYPGRSRDVFCIVDAVRGLPVGASRTLFCRLAPGASNHHQEGLTPLYAAAS